MPVAARTKKKGKKGKAQGAGAPSAVVATPLKTWRPELFVSLRGPHTPMLQGFIEQTGDFRGSLTARSADGSLNTGRIGSARDLVLEHLAAEQAKLYVEREKKYSEQQRKFQAELALEKAEADAARRAWTAAVDRDAEERRQHAKAAQQERERRAVERLKEVAEQKAEEEALALDERNRRLAEQARDMENRMRKKAEEEAREREIQQAITAKRARESRERAREEAEQRQRAAELDAQARRAKQEAMSRKLKQEAQQRAREEAEVKRRFKASEEQRVASEAARRAEERREARRKEEAFRRKMDEKKQKEREAMREREAAAKKAAKEALALMYQEDEHGRLVRIKDPSFELNKKMRALAAENEAAQAARDAALAAKQAAFERAKKEDERRRQLQVEASQKEVAAIFQKNQEKELADRLAREEQQRAQYRKLAIETREKIEEDNRRQREAERLAELHLKEAKDAEYRAVRAAHARRETMETLKAANERMLQQQNWQLLMRWEGQESEAGKETQLKAKQLFQQQLKMREEHSAENHRQGTSQRI